MCAKAHVARILLFSYFASALPCCGCALPLSHLWTKSESKVAEPPAVQTEQVWDKSANRDNLKTDLPEQAMPFEPAPEARYKWIVYDDFSFHPQNISARVVARDALLVVEYTALTATVVVGIFCGHGCSLGGCSLPCPIPPGASP
jgi:hypothetical protein